jgi:hypothetical protein
MRGLGGATAEQLRPSQGERERRRGREAEEEAEEEEERKDVSH